MMNVIGYDSSAERCFLRTIMLRMTRFYNSASGDEYLTDGIVPRDGCLVAFRYQTMWMRGRVCALPDGGIECVMIDFGVTSRVSDPVNDVRILADEFQPLSSYALSSILEDWEWNMDIVMAAVNALPEDDGRYFDTNQWSMPIQDIGHYL